MVNYLQMNVAKIVTVPMTKLVYQTTALTHVLVQPVGKMQSVMQSVTEPNALVLVDCREILMLPVFLLDAAEIQIARTENNVI